MLIQNRKQTQNTNRQTKLYIKLLAWLPTVILACMIFWFSAQPADNSTQMSSGVIEVLYGIFSGIFGESTDLKTAIEILSYPVRKSAHIMEYAVFYLTLLFAFYVWGVRRYRWIIYSLGMTFFYACTDEFHQLFVPGRSGQFSDVLIDMIGVVLLAILLVWRR